MSPRYEYFSPETDPLVFVCPETGEKATDEYLEFLLDVDHLRKVCEFPFVATSGYRSPRNSTESKKDQPGEHTVGAIDIQITNSSQRFTLLYWAFKFGFTGIGLGDDFIHLDRRKISGIPMCWNY